MFLLYSIRTVKNSNESDLIHTILLICDEISGKCSNSNWIPWNYSKCNCFWQLFVIVVVCKWRWRSLLLQCLLLEVASEGSQPPGCCRCLCGTGAASSGMLQAHGSCICAHSWILMSYAIWMLRCAYAGCRLWNVAWLGLGSWTYKAMCSSIHVENAVNSQLFLLI